jgi:hypothetical protein
MRRIVVLTGAVLVLAWCSAGLCADGSDELSAAKERLRNRIEFMRAEIAYLDTEHDLQDQRWQKYKGDVQSLTSACGKTINSLSDDEQGGLEKVQKMQQDLEKLNTQIPLRLPSGPKGTGRFGAYYQTLKYSLGWDRLWKISDHADVVVRFDDFDHRFVFWRGTSSIPHWATYDGAWYILAY